MKVMKTITIPAKPAETREVISHVLCDLCGSEGKLDHDGQIEWSSPSDNGDIVKTTVSLKAGYSLPDVGHWDEEEYHVCPDCFRTKLKEWFASLGAKVTNRKIDWRA